MSSSLQSPSCLYTAWCLHLFSHRPVSILHGIFISSVTVLSLSNATYCLHLLSHRSFPFKCCAVSSSLQSPSCPFLVLCGVCIYPVILFSLFGSCLVSWALLGRFPVPLCIVSSFLQSEILSLSFNYFFSGFNPSVTFVSISSTV